MFTALQSKCSNRNCLYNKKYLDCHLWVKAFALRLPLLQNLLSCSEELADIHSFFSFFLFCLSFCVFAQRLFLVLILKQVLCLKRRRKSRWTQGRMWQDSACLFLSVFVFVMGQGLQTSFRPQNCTLQCVCQVSCVWNYLVGCVTCSGLSFECSSVYQNIFFHIFCTCNPHNLSCVSRQGANASCVFFI